MVAVKNALAELIATVHQIINVVIIVLAIQVVIVMMKSKSVVTANVSAVMTRKIVKTINALAAMKIRQNVKALALADVNITIKMWKKMTSLADVAKIVLAEIIASVMRTTSVMMNVLAVSKKTVLA